MMVIFHMWYVFYFFLTSVFFEEELAQGRRKDLSGGGELITCR